jgi:hypothetical protein
MTKKSIVLLYIFLFFLSLLFIEIIYLQLSKTDSDKDIMSKVNFVKLSKVSNLDKALKDNTIKINK